MMICRRRFFLVMLAAPGGVGQLRADEPKVADVFPGLWVQEDSGGVVRFLADGRIAGWPTGGSYRAGTGDWVTITSGSETLECRWKRKTADQIELTRFQDGGSQTSLLQRLKPVPLDLEARAGRYFIWHLVAGEKRATGRAVRLEKSGHFRTSQGGYYLRLLDAPNGGILAYASGEEDETLNVTLHSGGRYLVAFDRLEDPRLFASCMRVPEPGSPR